MFIIKYLYKFRCVGSVALLMLAGCATVDTPWRSDAPQAADTLRECAQHFAALNDAVARAGVRDAEARQLPGFPYLRVDRFAASLRDAAARDDNAQAQWLSYLQTLDQSARRAEISNLPEAEIAALTGGNADRAALIDNTARCAGRLREHDQVSPSRAARIHALAQVPDSYATWQRYAGLYALAQWPFAQGIAHWHRDTLRDFAVREPAVPLRRYAPPKLASAAGASREDIAAILRRAGDNALRIPQFTDTEMALLVNTYAPVFMVESGGDFDRIGRLHWAGGDAPQVDVDTPVVYHRIAYTRYGDATLTQIVYTAWFSARPHEHALDILAGQLDGVMLRVTLGPRGEPLLYDSIHPCGCYHLFFPTARVEVLPAPDAADEWAFVPATLPAHEAGARITLRIATRSHYVTGVALDTPAASADAQPYALLPEAALRTLPAPHGTRSAYGPDGLVPGTQRAERLLFWPMGIASAGAMRQWGHHATAFVGRRHFDDADLIEKRFRVLAP